MHRLSSSLRSAIDSSYLGMLWATTWLVPNEQDVVALRIIPASDGPAYHKPRYRLNLFPANLLVPQMMMSRI